MIRVHEIGFLDPHRIVFSTAKLNWQLGPLRPNSLLKLLNLFLNINMDAINFYVKLVLATFVH